MSFKYSTCKTCGIQFSYINKGKVRIFCSMECYRSAQKKGAYKKDLKIMKSSDFLYKAAAVHKNRYSYKITGDLFSNGLVSVVCKKHGLFEQKIHNHLKGHGCKKCGSETPPEQNLKKYNDFIERAKIIHNGIYKYPKESVYKGVNVNIGIICKFHGLFFQSPSNHLRGKGCRLCGIERNGGVWKAEKYQKICDKYHNGLSRLYIINCFNEEESFYKIGITTNTVRNRFRGSKVMPYNYNIVLEVVDNAGFIHNLESQLKKILKEKRYAPLIDFSGRTECYSEIPKGVERMVRDKSTSPQINLI